MIRGVGRTAWAVPDFQRFFAQLFHDCEHVLCLLEVQLHVHHSPDEILTLLQILPAASLRSCLALVTLLAVGSLHSFIMMMQMGLQECDSFDE